jgi:hypothetical protein
MRQVAYLAAGALLGAALANCARASRVAPQPDPVRQSPQYYRVLVDNEVVRVLEYRLKPGEKEPMHGHRPGSCTTSATPSSGPRSPTAA